MTFATDTFRALVRGTANDRVTAIAQFVIWFAAASFVASTLLLYVGSIENAWLSAIIGGVVSLVAGLVKFGH